MNVPAHREKEFEAKGWMRLLVEQQNGRVEMADPRTTCLALTQKQQCLLDKGHGGYHSIAVFPCGWCERMRRLPWAGVAYETPVCWFCLQRIEREARRIG